MEACSKDFLSIVVPMFNERDCLMEFHKRTTIALSKYGVPYEIVIVDDGSMDGTSELLRDICSEDPKVVGVFLSRNSGQSAAITAGFHHSRGTAIIVMDGDLQNLPEEIPLLFEPVRDGASMAKGIRMGRPESKYLRLIPSRIANWLIRRATGCRVRDMGGYSCIKGDLARSLTLRSGQHRFLPALVHINGGRIVEIPVTSNKRFAGESHYGIGRSLDVFIDIALLWFLSAAKRRPIYLFGRISTFAFLSSACLFIWTLWDKVMNGMDMANRPPFFISILFFLAALSFMSTGFMLEILTGSPGIVHGGFVIEETRNFKKTSPE